MITMITMHRRQFLITQHSATTNRRQYQLSPTGIESTLTTTVRLRSRLAEVAGTME